MVKISDLNIHDYLGLKIGIILKGLSNDQIRITSHRYD